MSIINRETDYAIRIMRSLKDGTFKGILDITSEQGFSKSFAYKIVKKLENANLIILKKGPGGGVALNCKLQDVSLYELMQAVENRLFVNDCMKPGVLCEFRTCNSCNAHEVFGAWQWELDKKCRDTKLIDIM